MGHTGRHFVQGHHIPWPLLRVLCQPDAQRLETVIGNSDHRLPDDHSLWQSARFLVKIQLFFWIIQPW